MIQLLINKKKEKKKWEFLNLNRMKELDHPVCPHAVAAGQIQTATEGRIF